MEELTKATMAARERTGKLIGVAIEQGKAQVQEIEYDDSGDSEVTPLSDWISGPEVIPFLNQLGK